MKNFIALILVIFGLFATTVTSARELSELKVLYVGNERTADYGNFLKSKVDEFAAKSRSEFKPSDAGAFDVVMLDWPQSPETREMRKLTSPLGAREAWNRPTVLL